jgi:hypothetical protein
MSTAGVNRVFELSSLQARRQRNRPLVMVLLPIVVASTAVVGIYGLYSAGSGAGSQVAYGIFGFSVASLLMAVLFGFSWFLLLRWPVVKTLTVNATEIALAGSAGVITQLKWTDPRLRLIMLKIPDANMPNRFRFAIRAPGAGGVPVPLEAYEAVIRIASSPSSRLESLRMRPIRNVERLLIRSESSETWHERG